MPDHISVLHLCFTSTINRMGKRAAQVLTERVVMAANAEAQPFRYLWDDKVRGFGVRIRASGRRVWVFRWRTRQGRQRIDEIGVYRDSANSVAIMQLSEARRIALDLRVALDKGEEPKQLAEAASPAPTLAEVWPKFLEDKRLLENRAERTLEGYRNNFDLHVASKRYGISELSVKQVTRADVVAFQRSIVEAARARHEETLSRARKAGNDVSVAKLERRGPVAGNGGANRTIAMLSSFYTWLIASGLADANPCDNVPTLPTAGRDAELVLTRADALEAIALIRKHASSDSLRDALLVLILTAQRDSDIREREWSDFVVDDDDVAMPFLRIGKHKSMRRTKQAKLVPLVPEAVAILLARHPGASGLRAVQREGVWVLERGKKRWPMYPSTGWAPELAAAAGPIFPGKDPGQPLSGLWHGWIECREHAKSKRVRMSDVHNLRHAGASLMRAAGISSEVIKDALGHGAQSTTAGYLHQTRDFFEQLGRAFGAGLGLGD